MGVHDDEALLGLAENFRQPHRGQHLAAEHVAEGETGAHRGQLVRVAHQHQTLALGDGQQQTVEKLHVHHGHLIHDDGVGLQGMVLIPDEDHLARAGIDIGLQQAVDGGSLLPRHLRQTLGGAARGGCQNAAQTHLAKEGEDTI